MIQTEVLIVGGGPAGSACAKRLGELGVDCLILDKQTFPRPKPCAGWVTPQVFQHLGVHPEDYPHELTHFDTHSRFPSKGSAFACRPISMPSAG